jgi:RimJ/RimL family protein N-acetyltransferase
MREVLMQNPFLVGKHLYLRALEETDAPRYVRWMNDPEVTRTLACGVFPLNLPSEVEYIRKVCADQNGLNLAILLKNGDRHIGGAGLHGIRQVHRTAAFGIMIGEKDCWGQGYGTEATRLLVRHGFRSLNLNRISLHVYDYNARAIRAYEKAGFKREGVLRQEIYAEGAYHDVVVMAILKEEWRAEDDDA